VSMLLRVEEVVVVVVEVEVVLSGRKLTDEK
jgi:hypothetical protein